MTGSGLAYDEQPGQPRSTEPLPCFWLRVDDVMCCIAGAYERHLGRQPLFADVKARYDEIVAGADLAGVLSSIAASEEASHFARSRLSKDDKERFSVIVQLLYRDTLGRRASAGEIDSWFEAYSTTIDYGEVVHRICESEEAEKLRRSLILDLGSESSYCQLAYEIVLSRGASAREVAQWSQKLAAGQVTRWKMLVVLLEEAASARMKPKVEGNDPGTAWLFGRSEPVTSDLWARKRKESRPQEALPPSARFPYTQPLNEQAPLVSIITSLYDGGCYIDAFLDNMVSQSIFGDCELIIVDAASPDGEREKIEVAASRYSNIVYHRLETRVSVYAAWNFAIANAKGLFLTNANLDDCRRQDSLELQAATLQTLPFIDIVHQDVFFSLEPNLTFEDIASVGFRTNYPNANVYSLIDTNSPHNAPMWRRSLHDEIGQFDASFVSAGDFDFWLRCAISGKRFYKLNDPHVGYFYNPRGISTRADTVGSCEVERITTRHARSLVAPELTMTPDAFHERLVALGGVAVEGTDRREAVRAALLATAALTSRTRTSF